MAVIEIHWPEEAVICDKCRGIIQAGYTIWFDDEAGVGLCEDCYKEIPNAK